MFRWGFAAATMRCWSALMIHSSETTLPFRRSSPIITCRFFQTPLRRAETFRILTSTPNVRFVMSKNRGVVYTKPGEVQVRDIADPKLEDPQGRKIDHGVILKIVSTNICGSDQHMARGRTTAPTGMVLGHEITGEVIEKGADVEMLAIGDLVSVPFNVACGRCRACRETDTGVCLTVNPG